MSRDNRKIRFGLWYDFRNPSQWHQSPDQLYAATLDRSRFPTIEDSLAERGEFELPVPICEQSDYNKMSGFAAPRRIVGITRGSNAGSAYTVGNIRRRPSPR